MDKVEARFRCNNTSGAEDRRTVTLSAVTGPENQEWADATPSGHVEMIIANPSASTFFHEGDTYRLILEKV